MLTWLSPVLVSGSAGVQRYPAPPYAQLVRASVFTPRPSLGPPPGSIVLGRLPGTVIRPMPPVLKPLPGMLLNEHVAKGVVQITVVPEKPHTTVYVGKISSTVEDECLRAILEVSDPTLFFIGEFLCPSYVGGICRLKNGEGIRIVKSMMDGGGQLSSSKYMPRLSFSKSMYICPHRLHSDTQIAYNCGYEEVKTITRNVLMPFYLCYMMRSYLSLKHVPSSLP
jgi:hypothetical protein